MKWLRKIKRFFATPHHIKNSNSGKSFDEIYEDTGVFEYKADGCKINYEGFQLDLKWEDITQIDVYKFDPGIYDQVEMRIVHNNEGFVITEELPGWFQFILKTKEIFPSIPKGWDIEIIQPPFSANYRTIYRKEAQATAGKEVK